jgi:hypothetical protein
VKEEEKGGRSTLGHPLLKKEKRKEEVKDEGWLATP